MIRADALHRAMDSAAQLCRTIAALAAPLDRDDDEMATALVAIRELAVTAHDRLDLALRQADGGPGIGFLRDELAALDEARFVTAHDGNANSGGTWAGSRSAEPQ